MRLIICMGWHECCDISSNEKKTEEGGRGTKTIFFGEEEVNI